MKNSPIIILFVSLFMISCSSDEKEGTAKDSTSNSETNQTASDFGVYEAYSYSEIEEGLNQLPGSDASKGNTDYSGEKMVHVFDRKMKLSKYAVIGMVKAENFGYVDSMLQLESVKKLFPKDLKFVWASKEVAGTYGLYALKVTAKGPALSGSDIKSVDTKFYSEYSDWAVMIHLNAEGISKWSELTANNLEGYLYFQLKGKVFFSARISGKMADSDIQISGDFTEESANSLVSDIKGK